MLKLINGPWGVISYRMAVWIAKTYVYLITGYIKCVCSFGDLLAANICYVFKLKKSGNIVKVWEYNLNIRYWSLIIFNFSTFL